MTCGVKPWGLAIGSDWDLELGTALPMAETLAAGDQVVDPLDCSRSFTGRSSRSVVLGHFW